ncbi:hypothetical protein FS837_007412 [Tulasnella sp. UAMH 9824]|nr:hypothetical protein FS837_007412 [Tulasnella sp. UAMH 9824]
MTGRKIGILVVFVQRAKNLPNKRLIGKQDPFCELKLGDQTVRTKAIKRGNQHPEWEETFQFPLYETAEEVVTQIWRKDDNNAPLLPGVRAKRREPSTRFMTVGCYAEDFRKPDFIGETKVDLTEALRKGKMADFFTIKSKERYCGEVYLEISCRTEEGRPLYIPDSEDEDSEDEEGYYYPFPLDAPPGPQWELGSFENLKITIQPHGRDAVSQGAASAHSDDPGHGSHYRPSPRSEIYGQGVSRSQDDELGSGESGSQPLGVLYKERALLGPRSPRPSISLPASDVERSLLGPRAPRSLPTPPVQNQLPKPSQGFGATGPYGTPLSANETPNSFPAMSASVPANVRPKSLQAPPFTRSPLPQDQYHPSNGSVSPTSQPASTSSSFQQYPPNPYVLASGQQVLPSSSVDFHQPPPGTLIRTPEGSTSSDSMILVDDIGPTITWISPNPVKVNGHFCDVYEGLHVKVGRVALKRPRTGEKGYDDVVVRRFEREATTWRRLRHPHILKFVGTFKREGHIYFVSPFISNGTLVDYIVAHPDINRIRLLCETADAVQYLHKEEVVHGDLKANNILIDDNGSSLLCDFGLTKTVHSRTSTTMRGAGTLRWQSPELWEDTPKSFESDVYAFGMTIVEVLTGEAPFRNLTNDVAVLRGVMLGERPAKIPTESSSGISYENVWDVASACWPTKPSDRISMSEAFQRIRLDPSLATGHQ